MGQWIVVRDDELYHHGIKGQKWGIRRYQNEDGSLTPEGVKRYGTVENFEKAQKRNKIIRNVAIGTGAAAAVAGGAVLAYNINKNRKIDTQRAQQKLKFLNSKDSEGNRILGLGGLSAKEQRALDRGNKTIFKNRAKGMGLDQAATLYDKTTERMKNVTDPKKLKQLNAYRNALGKQVGKKATGGIVRNIGSMPISAAREAAGDKGKEFFGNMASTFWKTPVSKVGIGIGSAAGSALVGYGVKRLKDKTREETGDEELASYMWQNPNKK